MYIVERIDQFNKDYIYFYEPMKNNIMNDGNFIRLLYSSPIFTLNGIYLLLNLTYINIEKYYNKYKCSFDIQLYKNIIDNIKDIEINILQKIDIKGKTPQYKIYEQLKNGNIKFFCESIEKINNIIILKIAGIWETEKEYGLTYKFIKI